MWKWTAILPALVVLAGCAHEYTYQPTEHATGSIGGHVAADYEIPPAAPQGDVRLASFGLGELAPAKGSDDSKPALHLRMVVSDNSSQPWTVDTREQKLDIQGSGLIVPAFSTTSEGNGGLPLVTVAPGSKRVIDLFFPLPPNQQSAGSIPEFDAIWNVHAGSGCTRRRRTWSSGRLSIGCRSSRHMGRPLRRSTGSTAIGVARSGTTRCTWTHFRSPGSAGR